MNPALITVIAVGVALVVAWDGFCLRDLIRADPATVRYLGKGTWAIICLLTCLLLQVRFHPYHRTTDNLLETLLLFVALVLYMSTVLLSNVPQMPPRLASEARRFTWLVDVLYDRRVKLIMSAAVPPEQLYAEGPLAHEFPRTVSRLHEMQSAEFLALEHREVDTSLT